MSLQRLLLRAAFVRALSNGGSPPYPTIAEDRVYDSRFGDIQTADAQSMLPVIAVYTDADERELRDRGDAYGAFDRRIDVALEIAIGTWSQESGAFGLPQTDPELEALLDILETQIWRTIYSDTPAARVLRKMLKSIESWDSIPGRTSDGNNKVSARKITLRCCVHDDCRPITSYPEPAFDAVQAIQESAPYLQSLLQDIENAPVLASVKAMFAAMKNPQAPPGQGVLERIGVKVDLVKPETGAPDGEPDVEAEWTNPAGDN